MGEVGKTSGLGEGLGLLLFEDCFTLLRMIFLTAESLTKRAPWCVVLQSGSKRVSDGGAFAIAIGVLFGGMLVSGGFTN